MIDLMFLTDVSQVRRVVRGWPHRKDRTRLVTGDMTTAAELERLGIPFIDEWSYLEPADIDYNRKIAYQLASQWWNEKLGKIEFCGFSLPEVVEQELAMPFEMCLNSRIVFERLLKSEPFQCIYGYFLRPVAICRTVPAPLIRAATSVSQAVLRFLAERAGMPVFSLRLSRPLSMEGQRWHPRKLEDPQTPFTRSGESRGRLVLILDTTLRPQERIALERRFSCDSGWRVIRLSTWAVSSGGVLDWVRDPPALEGQLQRAWTAYVASQTTYSGPHPEIFSNPYLLFQFERVWAEMRTAVQLGDAFCALLNTLQPSLIVLGYDAFALERTLVRVAHSKGVPTVGLIHGGLGHSINSGGLTGDAEYVMVWGQDDVRYLTTYGVDQARLRVVGSLQYDDLYQYLNSASYNNNSNREKMNARQSLKLPIQRPVVLLLTANVTMGMAVPCANPTLHRKTWREVVALAARRSDLTFVIKPHPSYDHYEFYRYLTRSGPPNLFLLENTKLDVALAASDIGVLVNYPSTSGLEALLHNVPVVFLRTAIYHLSGPGDPVKEHGAVLTYSVAELEAAIDRLLRDPRFSEEVRDDAQLLLESVLGDRGQSALDRMMLQFDKIALPAAAARYSGEVSTPEQQMNLQLAEAAGLLWEDNRQANFLTAWKGLVELMITTRQTDAQLQGALLGITYLIGATANDPDELRRLVVASIAALGNDPAVSREAVRRLLLSAYLAAMARHVNSGQSKLVWSYALKVFIELPGPVFSSRLFWRLVVESLAGRSRLGLLLVNIGRWIRIFLVRIRPGKYLYITQ